MSDRCCESGCSGDVHAKGRCKAHYSAWYRLQNPGKVKRYNNGRRNGYSVSQCVRCGDPVLPPRRRYCTAKCQKRGEKERANARGYVTHPMVELRCSWCQSSYQGIKPSGRSKGEQRYCSQGCQNEGKRWLHLTRSVPIRWACWINDRTWYRVDNPTARKRRQGQPIGPSCLVRKAPKPVRLFVQGACVECGEQFTGYTFNWLKVPRFCSLRCSRTEHRYRRRIRFKDAFVEPVYRKKIFERDEWTCRLCGELVDPDALPPDYLAPTLDHILPLSLGGDHSYANVQCAHFICNSRKGDRVEGQLSFAA